MDSRDPRLDAARKGLGLHQWADTITPGAGTIVLTTATLVYNLAANERVMIDHMVFSVETVSDHCHFYVVACDAVDGGGGYRRLSSGRHVQTGAAIAGNTEGVAVFCVPLVASYRMGDRSVTIVVEAPDGAEIVSCGWDGWRETEGA